MALAPTETKESLADRLASELTKPQATSEALQELLEDVQLRRNEKPEILARVRERLTNLEQAEKRQLDVNLNELLSRFQQKTECQQLLEDVLRLRQGIEELRASMPGEQHMKQSWLSEQWSDIRKDFSEGSMLKKAGYVSGALIGYKIVTGAWKWIKNFFSSDAEKDRGFFGKMLDLGAVALGVAAGAVGFRTALKAGNGLASDAKDSTRDFFVGIWNSVVPSAMRAKTSAELKKEKEENNGVPENASKELQNLVEQGRWIDAYLYAKANGGGFSVSASGVPSLSIPGGEPITLTPEVAKDVVEYVNEHSEGSSIAWFEDGAFYVFSSALAGKILYGTEFFPKTIGGKLLTVAKVGMGPLEPLVQLSKMGSYAFKARGWEQFKANYVTQSRPAMLGRSAINAARSVFDGDIRTEQALLETIRRRMEVKRTIDLLKMGKNASKAAPFQNALAELSALDKRIGDGLNLMDDELKSGGKLASDALKEMVKVRDLEGMYEHHMERFFGSGSTAEASAVSEAASGASGAEAAAARTAASAAGAEAEVAASAAPKSGWQPRIFNPEGGATGASGATEALESSVATRTAASTASETLPEAAGAMDDAMGALAQDKVDDLLRIVDSPEFQALLKQDAPQATRLNRAVTIAKSMKGHAVGVGLCAAITGVLVWMKNMEIDAEKNPEIKKVLVQERGDLLKGALAYVPATLAGSAATAAGYGTLVATGAGIVVTLPVIAAQMYASTLREGMKEWAKTSEDWTTEDGATLIQAIRRKSSEGKDGLGIAEAHAAGATGWESLFGGDGDEQFKSLEGVNAPIRREVHAAYFFQSMGPLVGVDGIKEHVRDAMKYVEIGTDRRFTETYTRTLREGESYAELQELLRQGETSVPYLYDGQRRTMDLSVLRGSFYKQDGSLDSMQVRAVKQLIQQYQNEFKPSEELFSWRCDRIARIQNMQDAMRPEPEILQEITLRVLLALKHDILRAEADIRDAGEEGFEPNLIRIFLRQRILDGASKIAHDVYRGETEMSAKDYAERIDALRTACQEVRLNGERMKAYYFATAKPAIMEQFPSDGSNAQKLLLSSMKSVQGVTLEQCLLSLVPHIGGPEAVFQAA